MTPRRDISLETITRFYQTATSFDRIKFMDPLEVVVGDLLRAAGLKLSVAESCTGGLVGHRLTNVAGSSDYFLGGVISYSNEAKITMLGVAEGTLIANGAVSSETVAEMADGVKDRIDSEVSLAISGIAGPGGGTAEKPVGLVWIGLSTLDGVSTVHYRFDGTREEIKTKAAEAALRMLHDYLVNLPLQPP
jgi:PncC family amidohydrolase